MAETSIFHPGSESSASWRWARKVKQALAVLQEGYAAYQRYGTLNSMTDRQLDQLGLKRADIAREAIFPQKHF